MQKGNVFIVLLISVFLISFSSASLFGDFFGKITGDAIVNNGDCSYNFNGALHTGKNNTIGLDNGDPRFLCLNNKFYECGWEGSIPSLVVEAVQGQFVGSYQCDLNWDAWISIVPQQTICSSFTYSSWSECSSSGIQTRTVLSSDPTGCVGGSPVLTQTCVYQSNTPTCTDTDNSTLTEGFNSVSSTINGYVYGKEHNSQNELVDYIKNDVCSGKVVYEYYCDGNENKMKILGCAIACSDGRCVSADEVAEGKVISSNLAITWDRYPEDYIRINNGNVAVYTNPKLKTNAGFLSVSADDVSAGAWCDLVNSNYFEGMGQLEVGVVQNGQYSQAINSSSFKFVNGEWIIVSSASLGTVYCSYQDYQRIAYFNCLEDDSGIDYYKHSTTSYALAPGSGSTRINATDYCISGLPMNLNYPVNSSEWLVEYNCPSEANLLSVEIDYSEDYQILYKCPNGCYQGACIPSSLSNTSSGGGSSGIRTGSNATTTPVNVSSPTPSVPTSPQASTSTVQKILNWFGRLFK